MACTTVYVANIINCTHACSTHICARTQACGHIVLVTYATYACITYAQSKANKKSKWIDRTEPRQHSQSTCYILQVREILHLSLYWYIRCMCCVGMEYVCIGMYCALQQRPLAGGLRASLHGVCMSDAIVLGCLLGWSCTAITMQGMYTGWHKIFITSCEGTNNT